MLDAWQTTLKSAVTYSYLGPVGFNRQHDFEGPDFPQLAHVLKGGHILVFIKVPQKVDVHFLLKTFYKSFCKYLNHT